MTRNDSNNAQPQRYAMDIRVFLAVITVAMAISFTIGVALGPSPPDYALAKDATKVSSVEMNMKKLPGEAGSDDHEPAGQHLLVDIKGIESDFLDSEARLSKAMVDTVVEAGLTMLSYHCHSLIPKGVSCVGVLLESHISFHTWPDEGVITLDLFTCGPKPLIPVVSTIKDLFGIGEKIEIQWSHELRGFRRGHGSKLANRDTDNEKHFAALDHNSDLSQQIWSPFDYPVKEQIISTLTKYQRVDIWDIVSYEDFPTHEDVMRHNLQPGDPRWTTTEIVSPERSLFLNGVFSSETGSSYEYHEAMVQPAMFAHPKPKHVAIVGGGEGATLREVLKHNTLESVTMIEIDDELVEILKLHMPSMSNCSDFIGRADNCFDDDLANLVIADAQQWFLDRFGVNPTKPAPKEKFDVVIMDAVEPEFAGAITKPLYDESSILASVIRSLSDEGILAIQVGRAPTILDPRPDIGINANREMLIKTLEGFDEVEALLVYEDPHCGFDDPRAFLIVCRSASCRSRWYVTADVIDYEIYDRVVRTHSKKRALVYYDGVTHLGYQVAPKAWETVYCRREPTPFECAYRHMDLSKQIFEYDVENEEDGDFKATGTWSEDGEKVIATSVFANKDIPKGSFIMPDHMASSLVLSDETISGLRGNLEYGGVTIIEDFVDFIDSHGHLSKSEGAGKTFVEVGASYLIREVESEEEANVGRWVPAHPQGKRPKFSPVYERHRHSFDVFMVATKDIPKGTEVLKYKGMWDKA